MAAAHNVASRRRDTSACWPQLALLCCLALYAGSATYGAQAAAVMSVDLGSEWMKVGVVSPGVPMEIALNRESKRKTPAVLAFRDGMRTFGEDAQTVGIREPAAAYGYLLDLLGKTVDNPIVELYKQRFPYYDIVPDAERNTVIFKKNDEEQFSVEELIAQMLVKAKEFAQESTQQPITECVLTVPGYFAQAEREALLAAAQLANLKVLQLINDYTAVALNYAVFNRADINDTAQYYVFYDMGAYKTSAAVVSFQLVKDKHTKETNPVVQVLGVGYDRTLGGLEIQLRLRDYLAAEFNALKKAKADVTKSPRALAKLFKEAGRVKNVLSANNEYTAQIEGLLEEIDFKHQVTREKLEELSADLWPRVTSPLEQALRASGLNLNVIKQVILFGGGTRVPKVQEILKQSIQQELAKSLNADEAATMGAVYLAADLATGFKVKKFVLKDAVIFPIQVTFDRVADDGSGAVKQVKRQLFGHSNSYPQKKVITFNKHNDDFEFLVHYGDLQHLTQQEIAHIGSLQISRVQLKHIRDLLEKNKKDLVDSKGIKAYFLLDDSGIFRCTGVEYVYEKQKSAEEDVEGTLAKLGSTISKLFTKDEGKADKEPAAAAAEENAESKEKQTNEEKPTESEQKAEPDAAAAAAEKQNSNKNDTIVKLVTVKEPVAYELHIAFTAPLQGKAYETALNKLLAINTAETERNRLESAFNALESHVIETQQKLSEDSYASCLSAEQKQEILAECDTIANWLYEDVENPTATLYENRLKALRKLTNVYLARHWEHEERPEALKTLDGMIDGAKKFLETAQNMTKETNPERDVFTTIELETLSKLIDDTVAWQKTEVKAQTKLKRHEEVRLTVKDISDKMALLDREVKYLINKMKIWKPKLKPTKKPAATAASNQTEADEAVAGDIDETAEAEEIPDAAEQLETPTQTEAPHNTHNEIPEPTATHDDDKTTPRSDL